MEADVTIKQDWIYSDDRMALREQCLSILLRRFGSHMKADGTPENSTESIYACAHDWVSQGHPKADGIVKYYEAYYREE
jgi:hypothetical protein